MNHLTETQLNEYLDGELDAPARAVADEHLSACDSCRRSLADIETATSLLTSLPDEPLAHNLAPSVLANLPRPRLALGWKFVLAAQAGVGIGVSILVVSNLLLRFDPRTWLAQTIAILDKIKIPSIPAPLFTIHHSPFTIHSLGIQATTANLIFLTLSALLLWSVGNAILLRGRNGVRK